MLLYTGMGLASFLFEEFFKFGFEPAGVSPLDLIYSIIIIMLGVYVLTCGNWKQYLEED